MRDLARLHEITSVLIRYGLGDLVRRAGIGTALERAGEMLSWRESAEVRHLEAPARLRHALEELGPTFVKLGQVMATRPDLIPMSLCEELRELQDKVKPFDTAGIRGLVEAELGRPVDQDRAELGRLLFFDPILSITQDNSCAGCHGPNVAFNDSKSISVGVENNGIVGPGRAGPHNLRRAPTVLNAVTPSKIGIASMQRSFAGEPPRGSGPPLGPPICLRRSLFFLLNLLKTGFCSTCLI